MKNIVLPHYTDTWFPSSTHFPVLQLCSVHWGSFIGENYSCGFLPLGEYLTSSHKTIRSHYDFLLRISVTHRTKVTGKILHSKKSLNLSFTCQKQSSCLLSAVYGCTIITSSKFQWGFLKILHIVHVFTIEKMPVWLSVILTNFTSKCTCLSRTNILRMPRTQGSSSYRFKLKVTHKCENIILHSFGDFNMNLKNINH